MLTVSKRARGGFSRRHSKAPYWRVRVRHFVSSCIRAILLLDDGVSEKARGLAKKTRKNGALTNQEPQGRRFSDPRLAEVSLSIKVPSRLTTEPPTTHVRPRGCRITYFYPQEARECCSLLALKLGGKHRRRGLMERNPSV